MATLEKPKPKQKHKKKNVRTDEEKPIQNPGKSEIDVENEITEALLEEDETLNNLGAFKNESNEENIESATLNNSGTSKNESNKENVESATPLSDSVMSKNESNEENVEFVTPLTSPAAKTIEVPSGNASKSEESIPKAKSDTVVYPTVSLTSEISAIQLMQISLEKQEPVEPYTEEQLNSYYVNYELEAVPRFISEFVESELRGIVARQHPFHELLASYLRAHVDFAVTKVGFESLRNEYREYQSSLWTVSRTIVARQGTCQDGNTVSCSHEYQTATFNHKVHVNLLSKMTSIKNTLGGSYTLQSFLCNLLKMQIDDYVERLVCSCLAAAGVSRELPVVLLREHDQSLQPHLHDLRLCISILFSFQRKPLTNQIFITDSRAWLGKLISVLLKMATWQDHLFVLNHILRCPAGVGNWAASFVQVPSLQQCKIGAVFSNDFVNHVMAVLSNVLLPVSKREAFLEQIQESGGDCSWVVVDSEGEDEEATPSGALRENDLVSIFNQIPIDSLFKIITLADGMNSHEDFNPVLITENHLIHLLAFSTTLVRLLHQGLKTYYAPRYNQFAKRLCRLVKHCFEYVTDFWEILRRDGRLQPIVRRRLKIEYDAFFLRATHCLYLSPHLGAWQFLAVVTFRLVSIKTLWKLFYVLHHKEFHEPLLNYENNYEQKLLETSVFQQFEEYLMGMEHSNVCYLLHTFTNMALARTSDDFNFIKTVTLELLKIGILSDVTHENCSKYVRDLLASICSKWPQLTSDILASMEYHIENVQERVLYLFENQPISLWQPGEDDFEIISNWLHYPPSSNINRLGRLILSRLNWGLSSGGNLFLPYDIHNRVAILVLEVVNRWGPSTGTSFLESIRPSTPETVLVHWAWQQVGRLRLHVSERSFNQKAEALRRVPEPDQFQTLAKGVQEKKPLACYLSLLLTSYGHLAPMVCSEGLAQLQILINNYKYDAAIMALHVIIPLFFDSQSVLVENEKFVAIIMALLVADNTYLKMAKSFIVNEYPGPLLNQLGRMIESHLFKYQWYGLSTPKDVATFWCRTLFAVPSWNKDLNVLYILNVIVRFVFFHPDVLNSVSYIYGEKLKGLISEQSQGGGFLSLLNRRGEPTGLLGGTLPTYPWVAYLAIGVEHRELELQSGLWHELLRQLLPVKVTVDGALKKAITNVRVQPISPMKLSIYRWALQAVDTPIEYVGLPLFWQKFFLLYLYQVPSSDGVPKGCVGYKFFEGSSNLTLLKRIKKRLKETVEYYEQCAKSCDDSSKKGFYNNLIKLFTSFLLWLEEPRLQETSVYLAGLPSSYKSDNLALVLQGNEMPWIEYVDHDSIKAELLKSLTEWANSCYRSQMGQHRLGVRNSAKTPIERTFDRLTSYDSPVSLPSLSRSAPIIPPFDPGDIQNVLKPHIRNLQCLAQSQTTFISEHSGLDSVYCDLVPKLFKIAQTKMVLRAACRGVQNNSCSGPVLFNVQVGEARLHEVINEQIQHNRSEYESLIVRWMQPPAQALIISGLTMKLGVEALISTKHEQKTRRAGADLFYYLISLLNEESESYPPSKHLFLCCIERLGQVFIRGVELETSRLCALILQEPKHAALLAPHFSPKAITPSTFLNIYGTVSSQAIACPDVAMSLLTKFDVSEWLANGKPRLADRSQFISLVGGVLVSLGADEQTGRLADLHELLRKHLLLIFGHEFPEHYGEVLMFALQCSGMGTLSLAVWSDLIMYLSGPSKLRLGLPPSRLKEQLRIYATQQRALKYQEFTETCGLLARYFAQERWQCHLNALHYKYALYSEPLSLLLSMIGHGMIITALNLQPGLLADILCQSLWPGLMEMFAPWMVPYWKDSEERRLSQDESLTFFQPWTPNEAQNAVRFLDAFLNCVQFIIDTMPACKNILSFVWQFYFVNFARKPVKKHIFEPLHAALSSLPWSSYWPTLADIELMLKVADQYLPECHGFVGQIFVQINWREWLAGFGANYVEPSTIRAHQCLLHLLVKLSNEPSIKQGVKVEDILNEACNYSWQFIDATTFEQVTDWFVMSGDPRVVLGQAAAPSDFRILRLLKTVANYTLPQQPTFSYQDYRLKQQIYVRTYVKLLSNCSSRYKQFLTGKTGQLDSILDAELLHLESILNAKPNVSEEEAGVLVREFLALLNQPIIVQQALNSCKRWLVSRTSNSLMLRTFLNCAPTVINNSEVLGTVLEAVLTSFFSTSVSQIQTPTWIVAVGLLPMFPPRQPPLEQTLVSNGFLLALNACLMQRLQQCGPDEYGSLLDTVIGWLASVKLSESLESKLPLLWSKVLILAQKLYSVDQKAAAVSLRKFAQQLLHISENKGAGWGRSFLGVIGVIKYPVSARCRMLSRIVAGYVLAQMPDLKDDPVILRTSANMPGAIGRAGGNVECRRILLGLDANQQESELRYCAEFALKQIQDPDNSLHNVCKFLTDVVNILYSEVYLKDFGDTIM